MAIGYVLYLDEDRRPHEVIEELARELGFTGVLADRAASAPHGALPHLWVSATEVGHPAGDFVREDYGVAPQVAVHLRLDKEALGPAQDELLQVLAVLLRRSVADAVLLRDEGTVALARKSGRLLLGEDALWRDAARQDWAERLQRRRGTSIS